MADSCVKHRNESRSRTAPLFSRGGLQIALLLVMVVSSGLLCGCSVSTKDAKAIVKEGKAVSQTLANDYDALAKDEKARYDGFNHLQLALSNEGYLPDDPDFSSHYHDTVRPVGTVIAKFKKDAEDEKVLLDALKARADAARKLNDLYVSLGSLVDYDASAEVSKSADNLSSAIQKLNNHKLTLTLPIDLGAQTKATALLDGAVKAFAKQQRMREVRKNAPLIRQVLEGLTLLYRAELPAYKVILHTYYSDAKDVSDTLIDSNDAFLMSRKKSFLDLFGLDIVAKPSDDTAIKTAEKTAAHKEVQRRYIDYVDQSQKDSDDLLTALCVLKVDHDRFEQRKHLTTGATDPDVQAYLTSLNQTH